MKGKRQKNSRRKSRPRSDDRVRKIRVKVPTNGIIKLSQVLQSGYRRVRDCRLQTIRLVGGDTPLIRVLLSGRFVNGENISLAVIQKTPLRLDRTLTLPRRCREYFLDGENADDSTESAVILTESSLDYIEFTFLAESPPILELGKNACNTTVITRGESTKGSDFIFVGDISLKADELLEVNYGDVNYLVKVGNNRLDLLFPTTLQATIPTATPLDYSFQ